MLEKPYKYIKENTELIKLKKFENKKILKKVLKVWEVLEVLTIKTATKTFEGENTF